MNKFVKMIFVAETIEAMNQQIYDYANILVDAKNCKLATKHAKDLPAIIKEMNSKPETAVEPMKTGENISTEEQLNEETGEITPMVVNNETLGVPIVEPMLPDIPYIENPMNLKPGEEINPASGEITPPVASALPEVLAPVTLAAPHITKHDQLDARGIPWDSRIHTKQFTKVKDGSWRNRRGINRDIIAQVEAELTASMAAPAIAPPALPTTPTVVPTPVPTNVQTPPPVVDTPPPVQQAQASVPPVTPMGAATRPAHSLETFKNNLMPTIATLIAAGAVTQDYINQLLEYFKVSAIWEVFNNDTQVAELFNNFCESGLITKVG